MTVSPAASPAYARPRRFPSLFAHLRPGPPDPARDIQRIVVITSVLVWCALSLHSYLVEPTRDRLSPTEVSQWALSSVSFLILFLLTQARRPTLLLLALQSVLVLTGNALLRGSSVQAGLLILIAAQVGLLIPWRWALLWVAAQSGALLLIMLVHWKHDLDGLAFSTGYLCFQMFAVTTTRTALREIRSRHALAQVVDELRATRALLADASRQAERLQISRDLHDLLGHHLTALGMHLQVAAHLLPPHAPARPHLLTAQQVTGDLLSDVRSAVRGLRHTACCDLPAELAALSAAAPVRVHLDWAPDVHVHCPVQAQVLLRSVQEILTNAARHARATQVWLTVHRDAGTLHLRAHDDGPRRPADLRFGCGLTGMRERLESVGGTLDVQLSPACGVTLHLTLPARGTA
ncbi:sensor histidine kinase [Deinococcus soli (ex Cha et al. 2016)]|uniref:sensor histidine kinase n=1 Tax=Deinococcus soli (ex Cha et al. 2016) TaxID=1309411 RepID=UPI00166D884F|nr:histidine kinase [Deinococcus soli (ex Cha et al. 2016)]GGB76154.1 hypothetical protein GCM10008019_35470 [Deinococcus soli (ex Cha et al. 2016)]